MVPKFGSSRPVELLLLANKRGRPPHGAELLKARPPEAVPSHAGDGTVLAARIAIPGRAQAVRRRPFPGKLGRSEP